MLSGITIIQSNRNASLGERLAMIVDGLCRIARLEPQAGECLARAQRYRIGPHKVDRSLQCVHGI
jgi:hypothetical protein